MKKIKTCPFQNTTTCRGNLPIHITGIKSSILVQLIILLIKVPNPAETKYSFITSARIKDQLIPKES
jgi:hypothetical protein